MEGLYQTYLDNLAAARGLAKPRFSADLSDEALIGAIRERAERLYHLHQENDAILKEILFSKTGETLMEQEAAALEELAGALFNYNRSPDVGVAYYIHKLLYAYAQARGDVDGMVKELYYQGITLFYLNVRSSEMGIDLFVEQIGAYFSAGAAYLDRYEQIANPTTRGYIIRCLGNRKYGLKSIRGGEGGPHNIMEGWKDYARVFEEAMAIVESPGYREKDPEIPWDDFVYTLHYDRTQFLSGLRSRYDPEVAAAVLESAEYVYHHQERIAAVKERAVGARTRYVYAAARYHVGLIPAEELMAELFDICKGADAADFSGDSIWAILTAPEYLKHYSAYLPAKEREAAWKQVEEIQARQREYLFQLPQNEYALQVSRALQTMSEQVSADDKAFQRRVLDYILACHPPTYIHSEVVAELTRRFCARLAQAAPRLLDGAFGMERPADSPRELALLLEKAYYSGLYLDLGKCMLISYVGQYSRRLLDEEFTCIKLHPMFGCSLLETLKLEDYSNAARYHHRSYDHSGGYPMTAGECPAAVRVMVDIITVVDALDAGTDNIGRSYAAAKSFDDLVSELRAGKGTRYAPYVVELLEDGDFCRESEQFLADSRKEAYLETYREKK